MTAHELVTQAENLPLLSHAALRLANLLGHDTRANHELVEIIRCDSVITARLLRACNSPLFGFAQPVESMDQAVLLLGHQKILQLVLTLSFGSALSCALPGYGVEANELWHHSLTTAMTAEMIARNHPDLDADPSTAFTCGLLHDIGKLLLHQVLTPETQSAIRAKISERISSADAETMVLGVDHSAVGACLLGSWNLPGSIVEAVANHHQPVLNPIPKLSVVTHLADCLAHLAGSSPGWESFAIHVDPGVSGALGLSPEKLERMVISVRDFSEVVQQFMTMK
ncbi:MAG: metal dependent phosphohydrolase [Verrucomicrobiales bacterium]|nr:metal dependent phosphohydrolase [Verrucomicrobiales bacterium]